MPMYIVFSSRGGRLKGYIQRCVHRLGYIHVLTYAGWQVHSHSAAFNKTSEKSRDIHEIEEIWNDV